MADFEIHRLFEILFSLFINLATWWRNRKMLKKETQIVRDVVQISGQEEIVRIENLEFRYFESVKKIESLENDIELIKAAFNSKTKKNQNIK